MTERFVHTKSILFFVDERKTLCVQRQFSINHKMTLALHLQTIFYRRKENSCIRRKCSIDEGKNRPPEENFLSTWNRYEHLKIFFLKNWWTKDKSFYWREAVSRIRWQFCIHAIERKKFVCPEATVLIDDGRTRQFQVTKTQQILLPVPAIPARGRWHRLETDTLSLFLKVVEHDSSADRTALELRLSVTPPGGLRQLRFPSFLAEGTKHVCVWRLSTRELGIPFRSCSGFSLSQCRCAFLFFFFLTGSWRVGTDWREISSVWAVYFLTFSFRLLLLVQIRQSKKVIMRSSLFLSVTASVPLRLSVFVCVSQSVSLSVCQSLSFSLSVSLSLWHTPIHPHLHDGVLRIHADACVCVCVCVCVCGFESCHSDS